MNHKHYTEAILMVIFLLIIAETGVCIVLNEFLSSKAGRLAQFSLGTITCSILFYKLSVLLFYQTELSLKVIVQLKIYYLLFGMQCFDILLVIEFSNIWMLSLSKAFCKIR